MLSQIIEEEGVPTAGISLVRPHTETIKPPRALWVPFALGRPMGPPDNPAFQTRVLNALLKLFDAPAGPVLDDFPEDEPESTGGPGVLSCPVIFTSQVEEPEGLDKEESAFRREIAALRPWYDMAVAKRKRTTVGLSNLEIDVIGPFIYACAKGREPENPNKEMGLPYTIKFAAEDLKAYYLEAITAQPGQEAASGQALEDWFWDDTRAGEVLMALKQICAANQDALMNEIGTRFIVPKRIAQRKSA